MKIYITKYALTQGIQEADAEPVESTPGMVEVKAASTNWYSYFLHGEGKEWCSTKENAIKTAEEMRAKKIASFEKQISKLKSLDFGDSPKKVSGFPVCWPGQGHYTPENH